MQIEKKKIEILKSNICMESERRNLFGEHEDVIGECTANICMEGEKPKTHLENEHNEQFENP